MIIYIFIAILIIAFFLDKFLFRKKFNEQKLLDFVENKAHPLVIILTLIYAIVLLTNLGDIKTPVTGVHIDEKNKTAIVQMQDDVEIENVSIHFGSNPSRTAEIEIEGSDDGENWHLLPADFLNENRYPNYSVSTIDVLHYFKFLKMNFTADNAEILEIAFFAEGKDTPEKIDVISGDEKLFDEQDKISQNISPRNSIIFDELFYVQNGFDIANGREPVNIDHPFLASEFIALSISLFGGMPFGFRLLNAILSILLIPLTYLFGLKIFKRKSPALFAAFLMASDFMHFVNGQTAVLEVFLTFFTLLGVYFFYDFYKGITSKEIVFKYLSLLLAGLFFGIGVACKWTTVSILPPLIVLWIAMTIRLIIRLNNHKAKQIVKYILMSIISLSLVPIIIYFCSYLFINTGEKDVWAYFVEHQQYLTSFHSGFINESIFVSPWYEWLMVLTPFCFYKFSYLNDDNVGIMTTINDFGNPLLWWAFVFALLYLLYTFIKNTIAIKNTGLTNIESKNYWNLIFLLCVTILSMLPWLLVGRSTYIYYFHFYLPYFILMFTFFINKLIKDKKVSVIYVALYALLLLISFVFYFPVLTGIEVPIDYINQWLLVHGKWDLIIS